MAISARAPVLLAAALVPFLLTSPGVGAPDELDDIAALSHRMVGLERAGRHAEALPLALKALELAEASLGLQNPTVGIYVDHLGLVYYALGEHA
jgi:hypothetical protein